MNKRRLRIQYEKQIALLQSELERRRARKSFIEFIKFIAPWYKFDPFHEHLARQLERVLTGEITKLMVFAPPQHGKSQLCSVFFPAFWLARRPNDPIILTSYAAALAFKFSRQARGIVDSSAFRRLFPDIKLAMDSKNVQNWELHDPYRGQFVAAGVGGPITGHGAMLGIIDDPIENWAQAQSFTMRENIWDWYEGTFRNRIWENGSIVIIMTRWHDDDLAGRLLKLQPEEWKVLRYPALAKARKEYNLENALLGLKASSQGDPLGRKPGEPLAPSRFSREALLKIKADVSPIKWAAQYDGVPQNIQGTAIRREWFRYSDSYPVNIEFIRYWDLAATSSRKSKRTAGVLMGCQRGSDVSKNVYFVVDVVFGKWDLAERNKIIRKTAERDNEIFGNIIQVFEQEPSSAGLTSMTMLRNILKEFEIQSDPARISKDVRLEPLIQALSEGRIVIVRGTWNLSYVHEFIMVPNGEYRDMVDATCGAFNWFERNANRSTSIHYATDRGREVLNEIL